jgi:hypothetical protein
VAIDFEVSHEDRLVVATIGADARRGDYLKFLNGMTEAGALGYRKIVDMRFASMEFKASDIRAFGESVKSWGSTGKPGPTALIVNTEISLEVAGLFREHARALREVRVFTDHETAKVWLDEVAPVTA